MTARSLQSGRADKTVTTFREFMRRYFPQEAERREREGCCPYCGAKRPVNKWQEKLR